MSKALRGEPDRILVTRLRFLGDVILTTPVLAALARAYPGAAIEYLCERPFDAALKGNPHLRAVWTLPPQDEAGLADNLAVVQKLRGRYDAVLDLFGNPRSAWITRLTGAPVKVGRGRFPRSLLYNLRPSPGPPGEPATYHHLRFAAALCGDLDPEPPRVWLDASERAEGQRLLEDRGLGKDCVAMLTGASQREKEWPAAHFVRLAAMLRMGGRFTPVFLGQPGQREKLARIRELCHSQVVVLPELDIRTLGGLLSHCRALVSADGGVMHLALALGLPTLALFGPTESSIWFPYQDRREARLLRAQDHPAGEGLARRGERDLSRISPEAAHAALLGLLGSA